MGRTETRRHLASLWEKDFNNDPVSQARMRRNAKAKVKARAARAISHLNVDDLPPNQVNKMEMPPKRKRGRPKGSKNKPKKRDN